MIKLGDPCPKCGSRKTRKNGNTRGMQKRACKNCRHQWCTQQEKPERRRKNIKTKKSKKTEKLKLQTEPQKKRKLRIITAEDLEALLLNWAYCPDDFPDRGPRWAKMVLSILEKLDTRYRDGGKHIFTPAEYKDAIRYLFEREEKK